MHFKTACIWYISHSTVRFVYKLYYYYILYVNLLFVSQMQSSFAYSEKNVIKTIFKFFPWWQTSTLHFYWMGYCIKLQAVQCSDSTVGKIPHSGEFFILTCVVHLHFVAMMGAADISIYWYILHSHFEINFYFI